LCSVNHPVHVYISYYYKCIQSKNVIVVKCTLNKTTDQPNSTNDNKRFFVLGKYRWRPRDNNIHIVAIHYIGQSSVPTDSNSLSAQ